MMVEWVGYLWNATGYSKWGGKKRTRKYKKTKKQRNVKRSNNATCCLILYNKTHYTVYFVLMISQAFYH